MTEALLTALSSAFLLVRVIKGPWMRNPQYVASAIVGAIAVLLVIGSFAPDLQNDLVVGGLAGAGGAWMGIVAFDLIALG